MSCLNILFSGLFKTNVNQQNLINFSKEIVSSFVKTLVTELPQVSFTTDEAKTKATDTIISAESNIPKDENG
jgi:hypothetical protein